MDRAAESAFRRVPVGVDAADEVPQIDQCGAAGLRGFVGLLVGFGRVAVDELVGQADHHAQGR
jgi:hypothetical protein